MSALTRSARIRTAAAALALIAGAGCALNPPAGAPAAASPDRRELTAGVVQRGVHAGMSGAEVVEVLGSPNIVTRGADGREVWVWDRVSSDRFSAEESGSIAGVVVGTGPSVTGGVGGQASVRRARTTSTQSTLTVVVRFDEAARVTTVSLHASSF
jgi:outer membrane protein assembly factor BamE (lipoprotein component of BamABCDE complex)